MLLDSSLAPMPLGGARFGLTGDNIHSHKCGMQN